MDCPKCGREIPQDGGVCLQCSTQIGGEGTGVLVTDEDRDEMLETLRYSLAGVYELDQELGHGGMAVVFKATEVELRRPVALKVLPPGMLVTKSSIERFRREARMAAALDHPNIIPIYRIGQAAGAFYIAMKYVEGRSLHGIIESQGALPVPVVLNALRSAAAALAYAHQRGIIHRDIKGGNILVDHDGRVIVADFGLARATEDVALTATGAVIGTPPFMSPEQWGGERITPQADQYALGVLAFQMLTGAVPFAADSMHAIMRHHFFSLAPDMRTIRDEVPDALVEVVDRALAKRPEQRYPTTRDMLAALEAIPFPEAAQRESTAALACLAQGIPIPKIETPPLPPLPALPIGTMELPVRQARVTGKRRRFSPSLLVGLAGAAAAITVGLWALAGAWTSTYRRTRPTASAAVAEVAPARDTVPAPSPRPPAGVRARPAVLAKAAASGRAPLSPRPTVAAEAAQAKISEEAAGKLRLRTLPPIAEVLVDGRRAGVGGVFDYETPAGQRRLRIVASGYVPLDTLIEVAPGQTLSLQTITLHSTEGGP